MHAAFFGGCVALAHARAEPFLLLGWALVVSLCFIAPPFPPGEPARWVLGACLCAFLVVVLPACWAAGHSPPCLNDVSPLAG